MWWQLTEVLESLGDVPVIMIHSRCPSPVAQEGDWTKPQEDGGVSLTWRVQAASLHLNGPAQKLLPGISFG